jgi:chorismate dehydratase
LCNREFKIAPRLEHRGANLDEMLAACDAALIIGDNALMLDGDGSIEKIDLGEVWMRTTGLPFVYAFWAGRHGCLSPRDVDVLQGARDRGLQHTNEIAREYFASLPERQAMGARYLRDNIKYSFGAEERTGLALFYQYAVEAGVISRAEPLRFF